MNVIYLNMFITTVSMSIPADLAAHPHYNQYYADSKAVFPPFDSRGDLGSQLSDLRVLELDRVYKLIGRVTYKRNFGAIVFLQVMSGHIELQCLLKHDFTINHQLSKRITRGDIVYVQGRSGLSNTNQFTIFVKRYLMVSKTYLEHPDKIMGIKDPALLKHNRYLGLLYNKELQTNLYRRARILHQIRAYFHELEIMELDMPTLERQYGGAMAEPFTTVLNDSKEIVYLSIAPELKLKQLLFAGFPAVYTLTSNFRNQSIDHTHQPQFCALEAYLQNKDYRYMINLVKDLVTALVKQHNKGSLLFEFNNHYIDFSKWEVVSYHQLLERHTGLKATTATEKIQQVLNANNLPVLPTRVQNLYTVFDKLVSKQLIQPTCVIDYPTLSTPFARATKTGQLIEQCEIYVAGIQLANIYSEQYDIIALTQRYKAYSSYQANKLVNPVNKRFLNMLGYGMPVVGGLGIGIDRLIMILLKADSLDKIKPFPL